MYHDAKTLDFDKKCFISSDYNKSTKNIHDARVKEKQLANISDISNLVRNFDLSTKLAILATKTELKANQSKIVKLQIFLRQKSI